MDDVGHQRAKRAQEIASEHFAGVPWGSTEALSRTARFLRFYKEDTSSSASRLSPSFFSFLGLRGAKSIS